MSTLTLFRGDADKIREFDFKKTNKHCLVGQGVYLSTSVRVAHSYRDKGSSTPNKLDLFDGPAANRLEAYEKAFPHFADARLGEKLPYGFRKRPDYKKLVEALRPDFDLAIEEKRIIAEYLQDYQFRVGVIHDRKRHLRVVWDRALAYGYVTEFAFPKQEFEANVIQLDSLIEDPAFWELMWDHKVGYGTPYETKEDFVTYNMRVRATLPGFGSPVFPKMRSVLTPYGFKGLEYQGGSYTGGCGSHRAFCIWDADYVNDHKVRRFK